MKQLMRLAVQMWQGEKSVNPEAKQLMKLVVQMWQKKKGVNLTPHTLTLSVTTMM